MRMASRHKISGLYYIAPKSNLGSILRHGILSHAEVGRRQVDYEAVYDASIVERRRERKAPDGRTLWEFANLYFQPRNPMLYRVVQEQMHEEGRVDNIVVVALSTEVLKIASFISVGNAASELSQILSKEEGIARLQTREMLNILFNDWWRQEDGSKRLIMSECLVYERVPPEYIHTIYVANHDVAKEVRKLVSAISPRINVVTEPHLFFLPRRQGKITETLSWVDGDMFFSRRQTLTISVNLVGVMGKGLASRAKYRFPDVYVVYQDLCRRKQIGVGKPYLYKREASLEESLADETIPVNQNNEAKWFLLFPTKRHWKDRSNIEDIEKGLQWIRLHYKQEGIKSLAIPALGGGLGGLEWRDVGPVLCRYLGELDIPVDIYLPQERKVPEEYLAPDFLLCQP